MKKQITLLMPGCVPDNKLFLTQDFPHLAKILSRANVINTHCYSYESHLLNLFALKEEALPIAALIALDQGFINHDDKNQWFCCADFVHFQADAHTVYLKKFINEYLNDIELQQLIDSILLLMQPEYTYLTTNRSNIFKMSYGIDLMTNPLWEVLGKSLRLRLPSGPQAGEIQRLMTEIQMQLNSNPVNLQRSADGLITADGVWMWGMGCLPQSVNAPFDLVLSDDSYIGGLAKLAHIPSKSLTAFADIDSVEFQNILIVDTNVQSLAQEGSIDAWQSTMNQYEIKYFKPLQQMLASKKCSVLHLNAGKDKIYSLTPARMHYFWRRYKELSSFCEA